jgi:hypothetical protein
MCCWSKGKWAQNRWIDLLKTSARKNSGNLGAPLSCANLWICQNLAAKERVSSKLCFGRAARSIVSKTCWRFLVRHHMWCLWAKFNLSFAPGATPDPLGLKLAGYGAWRRPRDRSVHRLLCKSGLIYTYPVRHRACMAYGELVSCI